MSQQQQFIAPPEAIEIDTTPVACDGGGPDGHPRVYLTPVKGEVTCPYCDRVYKLKPGAAARSH